MKLNVKHVNQHKRTPIRQSNTALCLNPVLIDNFSTFLLTFYFIIPCIHNEFVTMCSLALMEMLINVFPVIQIKSVNSNKFQERKKKKKKQHEE